jgi:TonB family protein
MTAAPDILVRRGIDRGLVGTTMASAAIHAALVALLLTVPGRLLAPSPKMESYTVDLVAPDVLGGTNLLQGGGKAKEPAARAEPPPAVEPQAAVAAPVVQPPQSAPKPPAPEPAKPAPESADVLPPPKPPEPPAPVHEAPKPAAPPQPIAAPPPEPKPAPPPKPAPVADAKPAEPKPVAKPAEPPKPVAKVQEPPKPVPPARPAAADKAAQPAPREKPAEPPKETAAERAAAKRDAEIAAAVQRRAASVQGGAGATGKDLDQQIAAAVQRRAQQVGAGSGAPAAGGLASVGPGSGVGGTPAGLDYILYQGRMNQRIKAAWAWAGTDKSLSAVIQFDLTPEGEIRNVRTVQSSGDAKYDASCERAVRAVNPLEPVPEKYRKEFSSVEMTFNANDREP